MNQAEKILELFSKVDLRLTCSLCGAPYGTIDSIEAKLIAEQVLTDMDGDLERAQDMIDLRMFAINSVPAPSMRNLFPQGLKAILKATPDGNVRVASFLLGRLLFAEEGPVTSEIACERSAFVREAYLVLSELSPLDVASFVQLIASVDSWCNFAQLAVLSGFKSHVRNAKKTNQLFFSAWADWLDGLDAERLRKLVYFLMAAMLDIETRKSESTTLKGNTFSIPLVLITSASVPGRVAPLRKNASEADRERFASRLRMERSKEMRIAYDAIHGINPHIAIKTKKPATAQSKATQVKNAKKSVAAALLANIGEIEL